MMGASQDDIDETTEALYTDSMLSDSLLRKKHVAKETMELAHIKMRQLNGDSRPQDYGRLKELLSVVSARRESLLEELRASLLTAVVYAGVEPMQEGSRGTRS